MTDYNNIRKYGSTFSTTSAVYSLANNNAFRNGYSDAIAGKTTSRSYVWQVLSAVADDIGSVLYENVINYIDNVANIDTCKIKALQSMMKMSGVNYNIFNNINFLPTDILQMMDILSIKKDLLIDSAKFNNSFISDLSSSTTLSANIDTNVLAYKIKININKNTISDTTYCQADKINGEYNLISQYDDTLAITGIELHQYQILDLYKNLNNYSLIRVKIVETDFDILGEKYWMIANNNGQIVTVIDKQLNDDIIINKLLDLSCYSSLQLLLDNPIGQISKYNFNIPDKILYIVATNDNDKIYTSKMNLMVAFCGENADYCNKLYIIDKNLIATKIEANISLNLKNFEDISLKYINEDEYILLYNSIDRNAAYSIDINSMMIKELYNGKNNYHNAIEVTNLNENIIGLLYSTSNLSSHASSPKIYYIGELYNTNINDGYNINVMTYMKYNTEDIINNEQLKYKLKIEFYITTNDKLNVICMLYEDNGSIRKYEYELASNLKILSAENAVVTQSYTIIDNEELVITNHAILFPLSSSTDSAIQLYKYVQHAELSSYDTSAYMAKINIVDQFNNLISSPFNNNFLSLIKSNDNLILNDNYIVTNLASCEISTFLDYVAQKITNSISASYLFTDDDNNYIYALLENNNITNIFYLDNFTWKTSNDMTDIGMIFNHNIMSDKFNNNYVPIVTNKNVYMLYRNNIIKIFSQDKNIVNYYFNKNFNYNNDILYIFTQDSENPENDLVYSIDYKLDIQLISNRFINQLQYNLFKCIMNYNLHLFFLYNDLLKNSLLEYTYAKFKTENPVINREWYEDLFICLNITNLYYDVLEHFTLDKIYNILTNITPIDNIKNSFISEKLLDLKIYEYYLTYLMDNAYAKYVTLLSNYNSAQLSTPIFTHKSQEFLLSYDELPNTDNDIVLFKVKNNISLKFNEIYNTDLVENGNALITDYNTTEQNLINLVLLKRAESIYLSLVEIKYPYYLEKNVRECLKFILNEYNNALKNENNSGIYPIDITYLSTEISTDYLMTVNSTEVSSNISSHMIPEWKVWLKDYMIETVAKLLTEMTISIRNTRENIKTLIQKNYMKGTFLLLSYVINEYLKDNVLNRFAISDDTTITMQEYIDLTEYFNISASTDSSLSNVNTRYWQATNNNYNFDTDTNNIFKSSYNNNLNFSLTDEELKTFYEKILNAKVISNDLSVIDYNKFLDVLFDYAADKTFINDAGNYVCWLISGDTLISTDGTDLSAYEDAERLSAEYQSRKELFMLYSANINGTYPWMNIKNTRHSSYQIHPYLKHFVELANISYPIQNIFANIGYNWHSLISNDISSYIGNYGELKNLWKNPLKTNELYLSQYESGDHTDKFNNENPIISYDGAFYPPAYNEYINNKDNFIKALQNDTNKYYKHLNLSIEEKNKICNQLKEFYSYLLNIKRYNITLYVKDLYGNAYILYKTENNSRGQLWIRFKDHPIAFPAYCSNVELLQIDMSSEDSNNKITRLLGYTNNTDTLIIPNMFYRFELLQDKLTFLMTGNIADKNQYGYVEPSSIELSEQDVVTLIMKSNQYFDNNKNITVHQLLKDTVTNKDFILHPSQYLYLNSFIDENAFITVYIANDNNTDSITLLILKYEDNIITICHPIKYLLNTKINNNFLKKDIKISYNRKTLSLAYLADNNIIEVSPYISYINDKEYINYNEQTIGGSFDNFNLNIVVLDIPIRNSILDSSYLNYVYNLNADAGMIPVYQNNIVTKLADLIKSHKNGWYAVQLLGSNNNAIETENMRAFENYNLSDAIIYKYNISNDISGVIIDKENKTYKITVPNKLLSTHYQFYVLKNNPAFKTENYVILCADILSDNTINIFNNYNQLQHEITSNYSIGIKGYSNIEYMTNNINNLSGISCYYEPENFSEISIKLSCDDIYNILSGSIEFAFQVLINTAFEHYHIMNTSNIPADKISSCSLSDTYELSNTILSTDGIMFKADESNNKILYQYPLHLKPIKSEIDLSYNDKYKIEINSISTMFKTFDDNMGSKWSELSSYKNQISAILPNQILLSYAKSNNSYDIYVNSNLLNSMYKYTCEKPIMATLSPNLSADVYIYIEIYDSTNENKFKGYITKYNIKNISDNKPKALIKNILLTDLLTDEQ